MASVLTWSIIGIFPLIMTMIKADWTDCPHICRCKWISGKKSAICTDADLSSLPINLSAEIQVLNISNNPLIELRENAFRSVGLINMQKICLKRTNLEFIHENAFRDLIILIEIDLSENRLNHIHPYTFFGNERLRVLTLNMNPLIKLRAVQFPILPHLRTLELEECQLESIHPNAFVNLHQLDYLNLKRNRLTTLSETVISPLMHLMTLLLNDNPWICDCNLKLFRNWYLANKFQTQSLTCQQPLQYTNTTWDTDIDFICEPKVFLDKTLIRAELGSNLTLSCQIFGDPEPVVTWLLNEEPLITDNTYKIFTKFERINTTNKWLNVSIVNITETEVGEYSCHGRSQYGQSVENITVILPVIVVTATTSSQSDSWLFWLICISCGMGLICFIFTITACIYTLTRSYRRKNKLDNADRLKVSVSFSDQNKMLILDSNGASSHSVDKSAENRGDFADQKPLSPVLQNHDYFEHPVHIMIDNNFQSKPTNVLPPPPEFSTTNNNVPINNIFISVTIPTSIPDQDLSSQYPDLLEKIPYRTIPMMMSSKLSRSSSDSDPLPLLSNPNPCYDNMGPRITANGSSLLLNESRDCFNDTLPAHRFLNPVTSKPQSILKNSGSKLEYVTL